MSLNGNFENYCTECDWTASTATHERQELAGLAIEHAVETGQDIESETNEEPDETRIRAHSRQTTT